MAEFEPFVVREVQLTETILGSGTYSSVKEAYVTGTKCAAKILREQTSSADPRKLAEGCRRWNDIRHPNIVQFLGVYYPEPDSRIPVLLMEAMGTTLHHFLKSKRTGDVPLGLKITLLHNVACGVAYLHGHLGTVHGHLSANKVLLDSGMVAKISADVGVSVLPQPLELSPYMPPEVTDGHSPKKQAIDIFSIGILSIFTITKDLPEPILPQSYTDESKGLVVRNELERREKSMDIIYSQLRRSHPLVQLIERSLNSLPESRPPIKEILSLLHQANIEIPDHFQEETKVELTHKLASFSRGFLKIKDEFERHVNELQCQMKGLLQGMATQRKMLPQNDEHSTDTELVEEQEIVYIVNFLEGIRASDLGLALGITTESLDIIDADFKSQHDENKKRVAVLKEWLRNCSSPTWSALVEAMCTIGQKRMANIISSTKGLECFAAATPSMENASKVAGNTEPNESQSAEKSSVSEIRQLKAQLARAKKAEEYLKETRVELDEMTEKNDSLERELLQRENEVEHLKRELKVEVRLRTETAQENTQLQLDVDWLKHKKEAK